VSEEEAKEAKKRKKQGLKIGGWVAWSIGLLFCFGMVGMLNTGDAGDTKCCCGGCAGCFLLLGFILVVCGYFAVNGDGFWEGCGDGDKPDYLNPLFFTGKTSDLPTLDMFQFGLAVGRRLTVAMRVGAFVLDGWSIVL
jgi:hypothetical protein